MTHEERLEIPRQLSGRIVQTYGDVYRGILIEISYPQESRERRDARRIQSKWPQEADGYRSRIVLFERDRWCERLEAAVAENDAADMITTRLSFPQALDCPWQPPAFRRRVAILLALTPAPLPEVGEAAEGLCTDLLAAVRERGIVFESPDLMV